MRSTFRVLFYVKKGSARPNGDLPLMCRLTVDGEVKQFSCKMDVPPRLWDVKNGHFATELFDLAIYCKTAHQRQIAVGTGAAFLHVK